MNSLGLGSVTETIPGEPASSHPKSTLFSRKTVLYKQQPGNCQEWNPGSAEEKETSTMDFSAAKFSFQVIWIPVSQQVAQV